MTVGFQAFAPSSHGVCKTSRGVFVIALLPRKGLEDFPLDVGPCGCRLSLTACSITQLGKIDPDLSVTCDCSLPGTKLKCGESAMDALSRLLEKKTFCFMLFLSDIYFFMSYLSQCGFRYSYVNISDVVFYVISIGIRFSLFLH